MKRLPISISVAVIALALGSGAITGTADDFIKPSKAVAHIGQNGTVCGEVASAPFAGQSGGQPTFLNLDRPYPNHIFTIVIWEQNRPKFETPPEHLYRGKQICVRGLISMYRGVPQIVVDDPSQIWLR